MKARLRNFLVALLALAGHLALTSPAAAATADPLPSWREGPARQAIVKFVQTATDRASAGFVPPAERIATFDNDGTLWTEHPMYTQLAFALDRIRELAPQHPEWKTQQPFKAVLDNDLEALAAGGEKGLLELVMASHAGMSTAEFEALVSDWFKKARHPRFKKPYTELTFQPMLELLAYLRSNGFKTYIVSGGGIEFMRPMTEAVYGIPPEQVIGSSIKTRYEMQEGKPVLTRLPEINFIDDKTGKPIGINTFIGRRPVAAFGNSDGDREMLEWTGAGKGARLMMLVLHDDAEREYAYGPANGLPDTKFGTFSQSTMDEAKQKGWIVISMKNDWQRVFSFQPETMNPAKK
ncbi:MAG: HAD phosphoserine phosphatase-like hydrolase, family IB [Candidatus Accumulibacter regalis]|uniref:HAD phosphoserine phosphatase-like hydrolase, family IB n=1 Tax=Accumulibacter regalis TaxID=522306 RepID=A0A011PFR7_ACCRE|nr:HAD family hydrolase [Accumulibacter sp.]EXI86431.1 MAG: HAD phosphoserine phosphatase-like hydrolase, family IB [Candidatus Accumulibacter regalis]HRE70377.1 HAD family hydrolase [Accumulibacter sp.]